MWNHVGAEGGRKIVEFTEPGNNEKKGLIFNIQKFSLHDGPGIRTTVFMKGCPLQCRWCSNPESVRPYSEIMLYDVRCIGCRKCEEACPTGAIYFSEKGREVDWDKCDQCLACARVCPSKAIELTGQEMTVEEVVKVLEEDRIFYQNSGGGMTVSGGEALLQWEFVRDLFRRSRKRGIHTALDTTGSAPWQNVEQVLAHVDLVLHDIKHMDSRKHREATGVGNEQILENVRRVAAKVDTWVRVPLIPGFNDSETNLRQVAQFASSIGAVKVSILPYHEWGASKYEKLGRTYPMEGTPSPDESAQEGAQKIMESFGLKADIGR